MGSRSIYFDVAALLRTPRIGFWQRYRLRKLVSDAPDPLLSSLVRELVSAHALPAQDEADREGPRVALDRYCHARLLGSRRPQADARACPHRGAVMAK